MMRKMRQNTKTILWVVVVSFIVTIFAVWGMDLRTSSSRKDPNLIGKVNDVPVTRAQFQAVFEQIAREIQAGNAEKELSYSQREMIKRQAWDNIVFNILTDQEIKRLGLIATDEEIRHFLRNTPPPEIQPYFMDEKGNFDYKAYQAALSNPEIDWTNLENLARDRVPRQKFQTFIKSLIHVSDAEVQRIYEEENTKLIVQYVEFPVRKGDIEDYAPSAEEVRAYYASHQDDFKEKEKAVLDVAKIDIQPSENDIEDVQYTIEMVRDQILSGEEFGLLAKTYSESPSALQEGETGFIRTGQREEEYFTALQGLGEGEISQPVKTKSGYYLLKLLDKKTRDGEEAAFNVQEIYIRISPGPLTVDSLHTLALELRDMAAEIGLEKAAREMNVTFLTTEPFQKDFPIGELGFVPALNEFAFSNEEDALSDVLRDDTHLYVAHVAERISEKVRPIEEVEGAIVTKILSDMKKEACRTRALGFYQKVKSANFESVATGEGLEIHRPAPFSVAEGPEGFGPYSAFAIAAFSIPVERTTPPIEDRGSFYIIKLLDRTPLDSEDYQEKAGDIANRLYQAKYQEYMSYWYKKLEENNKVEDYLHRY